MEGLIHNQTSIGEEIQVLIRNYKKDTQERKSNPKYFQTKAAHLNQLWSAFEQGDKKIRTLMAGNPIENSYLNENYFSKIKDIVLKYQEEFSENSIEVDHMETARLEMLPLQRQQTALLAALKRMLDQMTQESQARFRPLIKEYWEKINQIHFEIFRMFEDPIALGYNMENYLNAETAIFQIQGTPTDEKPAVTTSTTFPQVQLPKVSIPKFDGCYLKWQQFHDLFKKMIHETTLPTIQKMWYLKTNLSGDAERLVRHLDLTESNYETAWTMLKERFDNKRVLTTTILNKLLDQPSVTNEASAIKNFHDNIKETLAALRSIEVDTNNWDPLLLVLLAKKLDRMTHVLYEQSIKDTKRMQPIKDFLVFLEQRFLALEAIGGKQYLHKERQKICASASSEKDQNCQFCNSSDHRIYRCEKFASKSVDARLKWAQTQKLCLNCLRPNHMAKSCFLRNCMKCNKKHNTLLHFEKTPDVKTTATANATINNYVLLATARVEVQGTNGRIGDFRALLDSGSQINVISERAVKTLALAVKNSHIRIEGIGGNPNSLRSRVNILIKSKNGNYMTRVEAFVLPHIVADQPTHKLNDVSWVPNNLPLADPTFEKPGRVDLLLGAEHYFELILPEQIKRSPKFPMIQNSKLGWIIAGKLRTTAPRVATCSVATTNDGTDDLLERFWKLDTLESVQPFRTPADAYCETHFKNNIQKAVDGRFIVKLPYSEDVSALGESREVATRRFLSLERRLCRDTDLQGSYVEFMKEYERLGHMKEVTPLKIPSSHYFIPHHCVLKPDSSTTKLRVVFDASAKSSSGKALNDILYAGPTVQSELLSILLRFRTHKYVFTADIEKMYRQIWMNPADQFHQMIVWRNSPQEELKYYRLKTVTYGTTSAPFLATKCLEHLATVNKLQYPLGAKTVKNDFYVDDCLTGADSLTEAMKIRDEVNKILLSAGLRLRKWCANHDKLLQGISMEDTIPLVKLDDAEDNSIKTLGLTWSPKTDSLHGRAQAAEATKITKRVVCSELAKIFDPLGLFAPVVVRAKIFMQQLWESNLDWDEELSTSLQRDWKTYRDDLQSLNKIKIPRHIFDGKMPVAKEIHTFVDASEKAYGAAVYIRATYKDNTTTVRLLCAKSKVAPLAKQSLPRLELCAAVLGAELTSRVRKDLHMKSSCNPAYLWTDSRIVLSWINSQSSSLETFVANRVAKIQELTTATQWRHVSSQNNAADILSRGTLARNLDATSIWLHGPLFLHGAPSKWPEPFVKLPSDNDTMGRKGNPRIVAAPVGEIADVIYSININDSFRRLQRIIAYMMRLRHPRKNCNTLTHEELERAKLIIIRKIQRADFPEELKDLAKHGTVDNKSNLKSMTPLLDKDGIIRVGGRIEKSALSFDEKHPILLPYNDKLVKSLLRELHEDNLHCGPQALLAKSRQNYWIIKGKTMARNITQNCVRCTRAKPRMFQQLMGNLPEQRVNPARPFQNAGVDYCGPFWIHHKVRGKRPDKAYIAIFCCFATKAVHMETVSDLTTEKFIAALKRFMGRRGNCQTLHCDNATNFVGANNKLRDLEEAIYNDKAKANILTECQKRNVKFEFIPPRAPHFGGLWEAAVKSAKHLLLKNVSTAALTYDELETVVIEIEAILNSRPITPMSTDPNDLAALTPGHFLIGEPLTAQAHDTGKTSGKSLGQRLDLLQHLKYTFWTRWSQEYLHELQQRAKWTRSTANVSEGMMVLVKEDNVPCRQWPIGRIQKVYSGTDNHIRVVDVKTTHGTFKRPIHKLAPLLAVDEPQQKHPLDDTPQTDTPSNQKAKRFKLPSMPSLTSE